MQVFQMVTSVNLLQDQMATNDGQVLGQCLSRTLCAWWCPRQWGAQKCKRGEVNIKPCGGYKQSTFFGDYKQEHQPATKNVLCINAAGRCALIQQPRKLISTRKLDYTLATTRSQSSLIKSDQDNNWQNQGGNQYWMLSKEGEIRRDEACFDYSGKEVLSFFSDFLYRTRVRSLSILVSNSLTHSLTPF